VATTDAAEGISTEELQLALRNSGMPLEALRWPVTPLGLHYLLIHYDIPAVDLAAWRLELGGRVARPASLSLEELQRRETIDLPVTMECAGNGRARLEPRPVSQPWLGEAVGTAVWTGTPLAGLLGEAGVEDGAVEVLFTGLDRGVEGGEPQAYERSLSLAEALDGGAILAWAVNSVPLPPQHGFPLRLVVPGWYGMTNVKWLHRVTVLDVPFAGYQQARGYRIRQAEDEPGTPVTRMVPRALMAPPGVPEFMTRRRFVERGTQRLVGRAWSGWGEIVRVEVSVDGGSTWAEAELGDAPGRHAWRGWSFDWQAEPGEFVLSCRATDGAGHTQPLEPEWNLGGYANNAVQRVPVTVNETVSWRPRRNSRP
jgi:DMSO/TMAO reductase YedYZ molybdopterin-dependent catalytic subunit